MKRRFAPLAPLALALSLLPVSLGAQDVDVTGEWEFSFQSPQGPATVYATLTQEGNAVTGTLALDEVPEAELSDGVIEETSLYFQLHVLFEGQWFTLEVRGEVDGDTIQGNVMLPEGAGSMPFTGARKESG